MVIGNLITGGHLPKHPLVVDQGCGRLRHLKILLAHFDDIVLVDTRHQLNREQTIFGEKATLRSYVQNLETAGKSIKIYEAEEFADCRIEADLVSNVALMDVVTRRVRASVVKDAHANVREGGFYALVVPRNDSSILRRCNESNRFQDGHEFAHHGVSTFFRNFRDHTPLIRLLTRNGFSLQYDLSRYRQACLVARK